MDASPEANFEFAPEEIERLTAVPSECRIETIYVVRLHRTHEYEETLPTAHGGGAIKILLRTFHFWQRTPPFR